MLIIVITALFMQIVQNVSFCSAYCKANSCTTIYPNGCTACAAPFTLSGSTCILDPIVSGWDAIGQSQQFLYGGNAITQDKPLTYLSCTSGLSFLGSLTDQDILRVTVPGTKLPHFEITFIFFALLNDDWSGSTRFHINLVGTTQSFTRDIGSIDQSTANVCANSAKNDDKFRISNTYTHNSIDDTIPIQFDIKITKDSLGNMWNPTGNTGTWGVKQFILIGQLCHYACTQCWDNKVNTCTACDQSLPYYLSGTTCNQTCLTGYGYTDYSNVCVFCDKRCTICFNQSTNCTACTPSGTWTSYLVEVNFSCVAVCPAGYFENTTIHVCQPCNIQCSTCKYNSSYCLSCNVTNGYGWNTYSCYNPCPEGTFLNLGGQNCSNCNAKCIACENTSTQCFNCTLSGSNQAYYFLNASDPSVTCFTNCPVQHYKQNYHLAGPNVCLPCDISCYQCTSSPTPCTICNQNYYMFQSACVSECPEDYFKDQVTWTCLPCQTRCTILTITITLPYEDKKQLQIDMNFSQPIDFTIFNRQSFQTLKMNSQSIDTQIFTIKNQLTSNSSYRISLIHIGIYLFERKNVTVKTIQMPSIINEAQNGRPFRPNNYQVLRSFIWSQFESNNQSNSILESQNLQQQKQVNQGLINAAISFSVICIFLVIFVTIGLVFYMCKNRKNKVGSQKQSQQVQLQQIQNTNQQEQNQQNQNRIEIQNQTIMHNLIPVSTYNELNITNLDVVPSQNMVQL